LLNKSVQKYLPKALLRQLFTLIGYKNKRGK